MSQVIKSLCVVVLAVYLSGCSQAPPSPAPANQAAQPSQGSDTESQGSDSAEEPKPAGSDKK